MAITNLLLSGSWENFDKVIRFRLETDWTSANTQNRTPRFTSATDENVAFAWPNIASFGQNAVILNSDSTFPDPASKALGDSFQEMVTIVFIDIFAESFNLLRDMEREINRIVWEAAPNSATRIVKSDASDSPIHRFEEIQIDWTTERKATEEVSQTAHASGTLVCRWYKRKS